MFDIKQLRTEILSGLTISIALVPEAISFALIVGVSPMLGLWAAVFMAASTSIFGGRPGLISGATGATAVIMAGLVKEHGSDYLALGVMVAGLMQLMFWLTRAWKIFELVPKPVISGFLTALALMILIGQGRYFDLNNISTQTLLITGLVSISCAALMIWSKDNRYRIPPALIAILAGSILGVLFGLPTIGSLASVSSALPTFSLPSISLDSLIVVLPYSLGMAIAGLTESLLTVDQVSSKINETGSKSMETLAQGLGNVLSGAFGSIGGCVLVGQTNLNISAGARTQISSMASAIGLTLIILVLGSLIVKLPLVGLIGVMFAVVYETGDYRNLIGRLDLNRLTVFVTIVASIISSNLSIGIITGSTFYYLSKLIPCRRY